MKTLEVLIGLMTVFLSLSLLASAIQEFIASLFNMRGKMLAKAIHRMFGEKEKAPIIIEKVSSSFKQLVKWLKKTIPMLGKHLKDTEKEAKSGNQNTIAGEFLNSPHYNQLKVWDNRKPSYLSSMQFFQIFRSVQSNIETKGQNSEDSIASVAYKIIEQAGYNDSRLEAAVKEWYDGTMDRVSGWYKRQTQYILLIIGFVLAVIFNVDAIRIFDQLNKDAQVRTQMVAYADSLIRVNQQLVKEVSTPDKTDTTVADIGVSKPAIDQDSQLVALQKKVDNLASFVRKESSVLAMGWENEGTRPFSSEWCKIHFKDLLTFSLTLLGWVLTAFAVSLGAPFWFDLLSKAIHVRNTGVKPNPGSQSEISNTSNKPVG